MRRSIWATHRKIMPRTTGLTANACSLVEGAYHRDRAGRDRVVVVRCPACLSSPGDRAGRDRAVAVRCPACLSSPGDRAGRDQVVTVRRLAYLCSPGYRAPNVLLPSST